jgi:hypothetical protein
LHLGQARRQEVDITSNAKGGGGGGGLAAKNTVLDQYICSPVLELYAAG